MLEYRPSFCKGIEIVYPGYLNPGFAISLIVITWPSFLASLHPEPDIAGRPGQMAE